MKKRILGLFITLYYFFGVHIIFTSIIGYDAFIKFNWTVLVLLAFLNTFAIYESLLHLKKHKYNMKDTDMIYNISYLIIVITTTLFFYIIKVNTYTIIYEFIIITIGFCYIKYHNLCYNKIGSDKMIKLVLLRHGESTWNQENRFTGWTDVPLSEKGIIEAKLAGVTLKNNGYTFDIAFTSYLKRAIDTLDYVLNILDLKNIPIYKSWKLNERHYGALQGLNKAETALKYGDQQVLLWRRSATTRPPLLTKEDPRYPGFDPLYKDLKESELPLSENLDDTTKRVIEYYTNNVIPLLKDKKKIIISAHGNSLRALVQYLDNISDKEIMELNIPTGVPLIYEFNDDLTQIRHYYLEK